MEYKNIANAINEATKNRMSEAPVLAETLENLSDIGQNLGDLDDEAFKSFWSEVVIGVGVAENLFMNKEYKPDMYNIRKDSKTMGGVRQRIAVKTIQPAMEDKSLTLVTGQNYLDDVYHGFEIDARVYSKEYGWEVPYSITRDAIQRCFTKPSDVEAMISQWITMVNTSINVKEKALVDALLNRAIVDTIQDGRVINLVDLFNAEMGYTEDDALTYTEIMRDDTLSAQFKALVKETIALCRDGFRKLGTKYNNGDYPVFSNSEDINIIMLTKFANALNNMTYGTDKRDYTEGIGNVFSTLAWQNDGASKVPALADCAKIIDGTNTEGEPSETAATYNNIVGVMFDTDALNVVSIRKKVTSDYFGSGDFFTYHNKVTSSQEFYPCANMVVFTIGEATQQ